MQTDKEGDLGNSVYIGTQSTQVEGGGVFWWGFLLLVWVFVFWGFFGGCGGWAVRNEGWGLIMFEHN